MSTLVKQKKKSLLPGREIIRRLFAQANIVVAFILLFALLSIFVPYFFTWDNMIGLTLSVSMVGMVACTMLFCLSSGDFDLSVESVVALAGVLVAVVIKDTGSIPLAVLAAVLAGALVGLINGFVIARLKINALITTLATMQIARGFTFIACRGKAIVIMKQEFYALGTGNLAGIPNPVMITILIFALFGFLLNRTTFGRNCLAIGGNREAARLAGIAVDRIKIIIFAIQGIMAASAGVVLSSRLTSGQPNTSIGFSLDVISACVLGGVSLSGGIGTISGVIVGVLIMGTVQNALNLLNVEFFWQYVVRGTILLLAVLFDQLKQRKVST